MDMSEINFSLDYAGVRGELRHDQPMKNYTSWRAGGSAERIYLPGDLPDLAAFLRGLPWNEPVYVMGLGSNLLVRDGGVRGSVVVLHARLNGLQLESDMGQMLIYAGAGVACAKVARFAALQGLGGAEFLAGIPGTVGGALAMNAGCYGTETWDIVSSVQTIDRLGILRRRPPGNYEIGYRHVALKAEKSSGSQKMGARENAPDDSLTDEWFSGAWFALPRDHAAAVRQKIKELLARRIHTQPLNLPNAGSVFRNPENDKAARLIESCGLKEFRIGGAMVSPRHANFIVNTGGATASDIEAVIAAVRETVKKQTGVELKQEVRIIGTPARPELHVSRTAYRKDGGYGG
ncbi:UDP-N-acetylmuramate dehydrogenase [Nitrosospira multiformis ATCC 25196]|uniref:UDP-N-acetylenolpyruvoylglucosamine reductase n=2 Tax=Nitrosospira multiformis (strain ATCC 25196 / NCIMB 11849 / C 71) TaxID=323848 RepID=MURB_NITMU|nr:UDP-N-acetylmuramate dehydrogenase [Nitrosospira multiformis]Q2Y640.1 RecName: Full=UDP-N-acetylenolpyruvoylglucosamine reductase; AltName: Full=UDP-N-acetylmuramate dehydrogenase [Nitrosospira multiformis ATCC 25196]ABB75781.1 UDP-N-acetylmuramate dehydrogenase [Nitrosospira multiformis ATCC 25196]SEF66680.1 UDP-N-acetylmuramate dehydrogenase [Nitrosospira multiformis ATCC 25196]